MSPPLPSDPPLPRGRLLAGAVAFEGGLLLLALLLDRVLGVWSLASVRFTMRGVLLGLAATLPLILGLAATMRASAGPLARLREDVDQVVTVLFAQARPADILVISLLAGVGEEALFRGVLLNGLHRAFGPAAAFLGTALLFGLGHAITRRYALYATVVGAYLAWVVIATGDLLVAAVAHAAYDALALAWLMARRPAPALAPPDDQ